MNNYSNILDFVRLVLSILCLGLCSNLLEANGWTTVQGSILYKGRGLPGIRVELQRLEVDNGRSLSPAQVVYSDAKGRYALSCFHAPCLQIYVSGRGSSPIHQTLNFTEITKFLDFTICEGLDKIDYGSFEYAQLFVPYPHQIMLDLLCENERYAHISSYITENIISKESRRWAHILAGYILFSRDKNTEATKQFKLGNSRYLGNLLGDKAIRAGLFDEALGHYKESENSPQRACNLLSLADHFDALGDQTSAAHCYELALQDHHRFNATFLFPWQTDSIGAFYRCLKRTELNLGEADNRKLRRLIKLAQNYCRQLNANSLRYYCQETKLDRIHVSPRLIKVEASPIKYFGGKLERAFPVKPFEITRSYDLQIVQLDDGTQQEERKILSEVHSQILPNILLQSYSVIKPLYGPSTLIAKEREAQFHYRIIGEESLFGQNTVIVEAIPRWFNVENLSGGKLWIGTQDGAILKIEWSHHMVTNQAELRRRGFILGLEPRFIFISEYGQKNKGFWYPSRNLLREVYTDGGEEKLERLIIESRYHGYQFFGVGSEFSVEPVEG